MEQALQAKVDALAADRESGASVLVQAAMTVLREARGLGVTQAAARALCAAQPGMAPVWNAALAACAGDEWLDRFAARLARAPRALTRFGLEVLGPRPEVGAAPLRLVTLSGSGQVAGLVAALAQAGPGQVACSESRPALEGRALAGRLAAAGIPVTCFADAALGHALAGADAVLVGADAVAPHWFRNKSGTRMLAALAMREGVPCYVVASRDKFLPPALLGHVEAAEGAPDDVWAHPPAGVTVRNPCFETTPLDLVTGLITDAGLLPPEAAADVCLAIEAELPPSAVLNLGLS